MKKLNDCSLARIVVNGIPVFAKGADVIPFDSFPNRVTSKKYRHILQSAKDANMNMVQLWGGGYESEEFYDQYDELGLMVRHDLMFGITGSRHLRVQRKY